MKQGILNQQTTRNKPQTQHTTSTNKQATKNKHQSTIYNKQARRANEQ